MKTNFVIYADVKDILLVACKIVKCVGILLEKKDQRKEEKKKEEVRRIS